MTPEQMIAKLKDSELLGLVKDARWAVAHYKGRKATPYKKDLKLAEAELKRRGLSWGPQMLAEAEPARCAEAESQELERYRNETTHRLKELLDIAEYDLATADPQSVTYEEAERDCGFIEAEIRRRD